MASHWHWEADSFRWDELWRFRCAELTSYSSSSSSSSVAVGYTVQRLTHRGGAIPTHFSWFLGTKVQIFHSYLSLPFAASDMQSCSLQLSTYSTRLPVLLAWNSNSGDSERMYEPRKAKRAVQPADKFIYVSDEAWEITVASVWESQREGSWHCSSVFWNYTKLPVGDAIIKCQKLQTLKGHNCCSSGLIWM